MTLRLAFFIACIAACTAACTVPSTDVHAQEAPSEGGAKAQTLRERLAARRAERKNETAPSDSRITGPGTFDLSLEHDGLTRLYRVHVPRSYDAARPTPVVFSFHGGGGSAKIQSDDKYYGLISKSEQAGFIAVFPNGFSPFRDGKLATFNAGSCCGPAVEKKIDDVGFVRKVLAQVKSQLNVDAQRISSNGFSNGAMMSYRLACDAADVFRSVVAVSGTDGMEVCRPSSPVSVLHIHARDDERVLFGGGAGDGSRTKVDYRSVNDTIARWVGFNACNPVPKKVLDLPGRAMCEAYTGCKGGVEVKLCVTETGGHSWPGGVKVRSGEPGSTAINANDVIWDFVNKR